MANFKRLIYKSCRLARLSKIPNGNVCRLFLSNDLHAEEYTKEIKLPRIPIVIIIIIHKQHSCQTTTFLFFWSSVLKKNLNQTKAMNMGDSPNLARQKQAMRTVC